METILHSQAPLFGFVIMHVIYNVVCWAEGGRLHWRLQSFSTKYMISSEKAIYSFSKNKTEQQVPSWTG